VGAAAIAGWARTSIRPMETVTEGADGGVLGFESRRRTAAGGIGGACGGGITGVPSRTNE